MGTDQHTDRDGTLFDIAPDALVAVRADGTIARANQAALDQAGRTEAEYVGRPFWELAASGRPRRGDSVARGGARAGPHRAARSLPRAARRRLGGLGRGDGAPRRRQRPRLHDPARRHRPRERRARPPEPRLRRRPARHGPRRHRRRLPARQRVAGADAGTRTRRSCSSGASSTSSRRRPSSPGTATPWPGSTGSLQAEVELMRDDGRPTYALLNTTPVRDALGAPQHFVFQVLDMTERHEAQARLAANESKLAEAQQIARLGSWEWTLASDRVSWSDELCRIHGLRVAEAPESYQESLERLHPDDRARVGRVMDAALAERRPWSVDYRISRTDGEIRMVHARGEVVVDENDPAHPAVAVHGTCQDVTEGRRVEDALRAAEQLFRRAFDDAPIGMALIDLEGRWLRLNRAICRMLGPHRARPARDAPERAEPSRGPRPRRAARARAAHGPPPVLRRRAALHARRRAGHPRARARVAHARRRRAPAVLPLPARRRVRPPPGRGRAPRGRGAPAGDHRQLADAHQRQGPPEALPARQPPLGGALRDLGRAGARAHRAARSARPTPTRATTSSTTRWPPPARASRR